MIEKVASSTSYRLISNKPLDSAKTFTQVSISSSSRSGYRGNHGHPMDGQRQPTGSVHPPKCGRLKRAQARIEVMTAATFQSDYPDVLDISSMGLPIKSGTVTNIYVEAFVFNSTQQFDDMAIEQRSCLTHEEAHNTKLVLFDSYRSLEMILKRHVNASTFLPLQLYQVLHGLRPEVLGRQVQQLSPCPNQLPIVRSWIPGCHS